MLEKLKTIEAQLIFEAKMIIFQIAKYNYFQELLITLIVALFVLLSESRRIKNKI